MSVGTTEIGHPAAAPPLISLSPLRGLARLLGRHRELVLEMTRREIADRYAGQAFGMIWSIVHPLLLMAVYLFVFAIVFKARLPERAGDLPADYTVFILCGLVPWLAVAESLSKAPLVLVNSSNLVKQVVFPVEVLPVKSVLAALFAQGVTLAVLLVYTVIAYGSVPWTLLLLPVALVLQVLAMLGLSFLLAALGPFFRDIKDFIQLFNLVAVYMTPMFYPPQMVPEMFRFILYLNPLSYMTWVYQDVFYSGTIAHPVAWAVFTVLSLGVFTVGWSVFERLKSHVGNVL